MIENILEYKYIIGSIVGFLAVLSGIGIYSYSDRKKVLVAKIIADSIWAVHFLLIGAATGAVLNVVCVVRDIIFYNRGIKKWASSFCWIVIFIVLNNVSGFMSYQGAVSLLPMVGSSLAVVGLWLSDAHKMRIISFFAIGLWFVYAGITRSVPSFIYNGFALASIIIGLVCDFRKTSKLQKQNSGA